MLNQVQQLGGQTITKAFWPVFLSIIEAQAQLYPVELRLCLRILKQVINLYTLPGSHLFWKCQNRAAKQEKKRSLSPFAQIFQEFGLELDKNHYQPIEPIFSYVAVPYRPRGQYQVTITENRSLAKKEAEPFDNKATYLSDGSNRNGIYIYIFFALHRRSHFATFGLYPPKSYPLLLLNRLVHFPILRCFSAPTRAPFVQILPYSRFLCFSKTLTALQLLAHLLANLQAISFPA